MNVISPGLVATPGVEYLGIITDANRDRVVPVENMAEACLHLVHGDPATLTGRITYAADIIEEFKLEVSDLVE